MPRKKAGQAQSELERTNEVQLAYLSRNHKFCRDIQTIAKMHDALPGNEGNATPERVEALGAVVTRLQQLETKWGVPFSVLNQLSLPQWRPGGPPYERYPATAFRFGSPVVAWTTLPPPLGTDPSKPTPEDNRYLNVRADLDYPVDVLLPLVERELRGHSPGYRQGRRRRLKEVNFYLQVFDLAEAAEPFRAISLKLRRRPSTVKSAYLAASRNIFGPEAGPSKKALPLASFDPTGHCEKCPACRKAKTPEEFCLKARLYANQDKKGQRELSGYDTVSE